MASHAETPTAEANAPPLARLSTHPPKPGGYRHCAHLPSGETEEYLPLYLRRPTFGQEDAGWTTFGEQMGTTFGKW
ncbi:MAG: hypothetical protein HC841_07005 [Verrucomicrobiae bacterium]|nr:hypothetical protein [Verrucomicrobiae bacterium]